jgi:hypothetical protein
MLGVRIFSLAKIIVGLIISQNCNVLKLDLMPDLRLPVVIIELFYFRRRITDVN